MKPLNLDNRPCSPISSNCVIWQGPDIPCIKLCTGDTVSDVVYKLATELCTIMDTLKITNYDLSCFNLTACPPEDFQALIQFLIEQICQLQGVSNTTRSAAAPTCPDCVVSVAECFVVGTQTTMQLVDYVQMIATRICSIIVEISFINTQIENILIRVETLENAPIPVTPTPTIIINCNIGTLVSGNSYPIDQVLDQLINSTATGYCTLLSVLGTPAQISNSLVTGCAFGTDVTTNPNWTASPTTLAESITNAWIVLCDLYSIASTPLSGDTTNTINVDVTAGVISATINDTGWQDLEGFTFYAAGVDKPQCRRIGNQIHFRGTVVVPLENPLSPGNVVTYTTTSYNSVTGCATLSGGVGCNINSNGSIQFNNGVSVIPTSILDAATNFDGIYNMGFIVAVRPIDLDATYGTSLSSILSVGITNDKKLYAAVLKDLELTNTRANAAQLGSSHLRYVVSNVRQNDYVPNYISSLSTIHSSPNTGALNAVSLPAPLAPDTQYLNNLNVDYNSFTYPFSCNAGLETEIGGFSFRLDGLIAYVDPCTTDIKNVPCP